MAPTPKERKPTATEQKLEYAYTWAAAAGHFATLPGEAEACKVLQQKFKLTRAQIALVLGLTERQAQTRLKQYRKYVATGEIPSKEFANLGVQSEPFPIREVIEDEFERREGAAATKQAKVLIDNDILMEKIADRIAALLPSKSDLSKIDKLYKATRPKSVRGRGEECAVATMSDLHLCLTTHDHDYERGMRANDTFVRKVISLTDLHRHHCNVRTLHLNALGDLIQGTANYPSQRWDVDRPSVDQAEALVAVMVRNIETFLLHFDNVVVNWANGNHEYIVGKKQTTDPDISSWGQVAVRALVWAFRHNSRVTFNIPKTWYQIVDIAGSKFMLTHGHAMAGSGSFDSIVATARKWADVVPPHDYLILGHFHRLASLPLPKAYGSRIQRAVYVNGTAVGSDEFIEKMGGSPVTQWWLFFVKQGRGVTAEHKINLYEDEAS